MMNKMAYLIWGLIILLASCTTSEKLSGIDSETIETTETAQTTEVEATSVSPYAEGSIKPGQQLAYSFTSRSGEEIEYFLYLPEEYNADQQWPLIISLHGFLGFNHNLDSVQDQNPIAWLDSGTTFPFILLSPKGPDGLWSQYYEPMDELLTMLGETLSINSNAIFMTGISAGGTGAWQWALAFPDRFAGLVVVAGSPSFHSNDPVPQEICILKNLPVWISYTEDDMESLIETTDATIAALEACGNNQINLTTYVGLSHFESIRESYAGPDLYQWMLEQVNSPD